jgi:hypothetical protein
LPLSLCAQPGEPTGERRSPSPVRPPADASRHDFPLATRISIHTPSSISTNRKIAGMKLLVSVTLAAVAMLTAVGSASASAVTCFSPSSVPGARLGVSTSVLTLGRSVDANDCLVLSSLGSGGLAGAHAGAAATAGVKTAASCAPPGSLPSVTTGAATGVTVSAATLHAAVGASGCLTQYSFQYGTTAAYGSATITRTVGSGTSSKAVAARIVGLAANTLYHFRIAATNATGTTEGLDQTFHTSLSCALDGTLPSITHSQVTGVTEFSARLHATISLNDCTTAYQFAYGASTHYDHRTPIVRVTSVAAPISASAAIDDLAPNTKYHFRLIAYSASRKAMGPDLTFKTELPAVVQIASGSAYLDRPFVAGIRATCGHGPGHCAGAVKIFSAHRLIGRHRFVLRRGRTSVILVGLDPLGRRLFRTHASLHVEVVVRLSYYKATRFLSLIRRFTVPTRN